MFGLHTKVVYIGMTISLAEVECAKSVLDS